MNPYHIGYWVDGATDKADSYCDSGDGKAKI